MSGSAAALALAPAGRHEGDARGKLEVVLVPVGDIDRAKRFYSEQVGFVVDHDTSAGAASATCS